MSVVSTTYNYEATAPREPLVCLRAGNSSPLKLWLKLKIAPKSIYLHFTLSTLHPGARLDLHSGIAFLLKCNSSIISSHKVNEHMFPFNY